MARNRKRKRNRRAALARPDSSGPGSASIDQRPSPAEMSRYEASMLYARFSSGPLPDPETLERYGQIVDGGAERIFGWVEQQSSHRQSLEKARLESDTKNEARGQWFAFIIAMAGLACGTFLSYTGNNVAGLGLMLGDLALLAGVFVYSKRLQVKELREKMKALVAPPPPDEDDSDR